MSAYLLLMFPNNRIRHLRRAAGLNQVELAERVGLSQGQISNIENGDRNLSLEWMRRIARALNVSPADLLDDTDNPHRLAADEQQAVDLLRVADADTRWLAVETLDAMVAAAQRKKNGRAA
jgi:transcriptional regulator with XRE-family HTH domain